MLTTFVSCVRYYTGVALVRFLMTPFKTASIIVLRVATPFLCCLAINEILNASMELVLVADLTTIELP